MPPCPRILQATRAHSSSSASSPLLASSLGELAPDPCDTGHQSFAEHIIATLKLTQTCFARGCLCLFTSGDLCGVLFVLLLLHC